jgi:hypothetical protein
MKVTRMPSLVGEVQEVGEEREGSQPFNNTVVCMREHNAACAGGYRDRCCI